MIWNKELLLNVLGDSIEYYGQINLDNLNDLDNSNNLDDLGDFNNSDNVSDFSASKFSIDSRKLKKGEIFIGIKGENFDGSHFVEEVVKKGAVAVIINKDKKDKKDHYDHKNDDKNIFVPLIYVDCTILAMHKLAGYVASNFQGKIIAITGSCGKTTTKNLLNKVLENYGQSSCTIGNFNNNIGLPLSLLNSEQNSDFLVLEMGMNHKGEIIDLCKIVAPDVSIVTNIASNHIGNFTSKADIAAAKAEIFCNGESIAIVNVDDKESSLLLQYAKDNGNKSITFGEDVNADIRFLNYEDSIVSISVFGNLYNYYFPDYGIHFVKNSLAIVSALYALNLQIDENVLSKSFKDFHPEKGRGRQIKINLFDKNILFIDDSYSASYESICALKDYIKTLQYKKILILGDILEIGTKSDEIYLELSKALKDIDFIITVGEKSLSEFLPNVLLHYNDVGTLIEDFEKVMSKIPYDDLIIGVKGSNKICLNKIFMHFDI